MVGFTKLNKLGVIEMEPLYQMALTIIGSLIASTGFWTYILKRETSKSKESEMLIGLGHDRIISLGMNYIERGNISADEYENLYQYLYIPYKELGGNGSAERVMSEVRKLPIIK